jgi:hypothetical protein
MTCQERVFVSTALAHEDVHLEYDGEAERWDVVFGPLSIGILQETGNEARFQPSRGRMQDTRDVQWSFDP